MEGFGEVISAYSRAQAIEDGVLVDISETKEAKEIGLKYPAAVGSYLWAMIDCSEELKRQGQSVAGRLWDVLWMFKMALRDGAGHKDRVVYKVIFRDDPKREQGREYTVIAHLGPGDTPEPVFTFMFPEDD